MGRGAICEWLAEPHHWEWQFKNYDKVFGAGIFCGVGMKTPIYNITDGVSQNVQQDSSIVLPFGNPNRV